MTEKNKKKTAKAVKANKATKIVGASCNGKDCPVHGNLRVRGKSFGGKVVSKFPKRVAIEFGRMIYVRKYERYMKGRTKIHARLPDCMKNDINIGDEIIVKECRPLSKIIHFVVTKKTKDVEERK
ncbi:MAG: 30S ribosomal protein S17 [Candidatus Pacearchaeota archaeon]